MYSVLHSTVIKKYTKQYDKNKTVKKVTGISKNI